MSDEPKSPPGPSHETLKRLAALLPSMKAGMEKKRLTGRGRPAEMPLVRRPRKCCRVCEMVFDFFFCKATDETGLTPDVCNDCRKKLEEGYTAVIINGGSLVRARHVFLKTAKLADWSGQIMPVSEATMDAIETEMKLRQKKDGE